MSVLLGEDGSLGEGGGGQVSSRNDRVESMRSRETKGKATHFLGESLEDIVDEVVNDVHCFVADSDFGMDLTRRKEGKKRGELR